MAKSVDRIEGPQAHQEATRRSRYGHRMWIVYTAKNGTRVAERANAASVKRAMLATGTQKPHQVVILQEGSGMYATWSIMNNIRSNFLSGFDF